jgi:hypothetical protein
MNTTTVKEVTPKEIEASLNAIKHLVDTHKALHSKMEVRNLVREHDISSYKALCVLLFENNILYFNDNGRVLWDAKIPVTFILATTMAGKVNMKNFTYANLNKGITKTKEPKRAESKQEVKQELTKQEPEDTQSEETMKYLLKESSSNVKASLGLVLLNFGILVGHVIYQLYIAK